MAKRVVVTGLGMVCPVGIGIRELEDTMRRQVRNHPDQKFDASSYETQIAGEVKEFQAEDWMSKKEAKRFELFISYALAAAHMAVDNSGITITRITANDRCHHGVRTRWVAVLEETILIIHAERPQTRKPLFHPHDDRQHGAGNDLDPFRGQRALTSSATACAAGAHAVGDSFKVIQEGGADAMITGGIEAVISPSCIAGFNAMKALSTRNAEPERASRPFDRDRDGFVVGEGAGILILEELEHALQRRARIYAEIIGYGLTGDGYHMTSPPPDGDGAARCMQMALDDAGIGYEQVDYINAHGTSTELNDLYETRAIKKVFREHAYKLAVSSTKSMTGHLLGGSGGIEAVFSAMTVYEDLMPPTINYENQAEELDLDYVPNVARKGRVNVAMSNSFGFGGTNATLLLKKFVI